MAEEMVSKWAKEENFSWTARFGYQAIEKRGTGGGGFRKLFALFLAEAADFLPDIQKAGLIDDALEAGQLWSQYALTLKKIFINNDAGLFKDAQTNLKAIYTAETALLGKIDSII